MNGERINILNFQIINWKKGPKRLKISFYCLKKNIILLSLKNYLRRKNTKPFQARSAVPIIGEVSAGMLGKPISTELIIYMLQEKSGSWAPNYLEMSSF